MILAKSAAVPGTSSSVHGLRERYNPIRSRDSLFHSIPLAPCSANCNSLEQVAPDVALVTCLASGGDVHIATNGGPYWERHAAGRIEFWAIQSGPDMSVNVSCSSNAQPVTHDMAEKVAEAMVARVFDAFKQPQAKTDQVLTLYEVLEHPKTIHALSVGLMKHTQYQAPRPMKCERRSANLQKRRAKLMRRFGNTRTVDR